MDTNGLEDVAAPVSTEAILTRLAHTCTILQSDVQPRIYSIVKENVGRDIGTDAPLMEAGIDSLGASELVQQLSSEFDLEVSATLLFDHPSVGSISSYVASNLLDTEASAATHSSACAVKVTEARE